MPQIRLNATSIGDLKACPQKFRLKHVCHIASVEDADSLRTGGNWHKCFEVYAQKIPDGSAILCDDPEDLDSTIQAFKDFRMARVVDYLNTAYSKIPSGKTPLDWAAERAILLTSFCVYQAYYAEQQLEVVATEQKFEIPLMHPRIGMPVNPKLAVVTGRMDSIVKFNSNLCVLERKSTSSDISEGAEYWNLLRKNEQVSIYALALRNMQEQFPGSQGNTLYDVWRKPQIEPKLLSEADYKKFWQTHQYCGQEFTVEDSVKDGVQIAIFVNKESAEIKPLAKGLTIRETSGMFAARLQETMTADPAKYFQRREIARTEQEIREFEKELFSVYTAMRIFGEESCYFSNPHSCKSPYPCEFIGVCYGVGAESVTADSEPPAGFRRLPLHPSQTGV